jgi:hypothetical protein
MLVFGGRYAQIICDVVRCVFPFGQRGWCACEGDYTGDGGGSPAQPCGYSQFFAWGAQSGFGSGVGCHVAIIGRGLVYVYLVISMV